jgi:hypothetical protein
MRQRLGDLSYSCRLVACALSVCACAFRFAEALQREKIILEQHLEDVQPRALA